jgi:hypothetical protein
MRGCYRDTACDGPARADHRISGRHGSTDIMRLYAGALTRRRRQWYTIRFIDTVNLNSRAFQSRSYSESIGIGRTTRQLAILRLRTICQRSESYNTARVGQSNSIRAGHAFRRHFLRRDCSPWAMPSAWPMIGNPAALGGPLCRPSILSTKCETPYL